MLDPKTPVPPVRPVYEEDCATLMAPPPLFDGEVGRTTGEFEGLERYGRYVLIERIGRGGMAEVFKAVSTGAEGFRRLSVIKRVRPDRAGDPFYVSSFCDEARISALLNHPNLVHVHEFGQIAGTHFLAMEYLAGRDLGTVLRVLRGRGERLPAAVAVQVALEVAHGLAYAHAVADADGKRLNLIHRDVTPGNIMLLYTGGVKLVDFGVARHDDPLRACVTHGRVLKGKATHMSPEQILTRPLDARSDIFSLGVVLWEMLTGNSPFKALDDFETMRQVLKKQVPPPSETAPEVPAALDAICARAMARDLDKRYQTAEELAHDLEEALRSLAFRRTDLPALLRRLFGAPASEHPGGARPTPPAPIPVLRSEAPTAALAAEPTPKADDVAPEAPTTPSRRRWIPGPGVLRHARMALVAGLIVAPWLVRRGPEAPARVPSVPTASAATAPMAAVAIETESLNIALPGMTIEGSPYAPPVRKAVAPRPPVRGMRARTSVQLRTALRTDTLAPRPARPHVPPELHVDPFHD